MFQPLLGPLASAFRREARRTMRLAASSGAPDVPSEPVFLYLHVPFCEVLCPFCSFHRVRHERDKARRYFAALRQEIRWYRARGFRFSGLYVGGGTPTVEPDELVATLALVQEPGRLADVSVETNPADLTPAILDLLAGAGVTRLSVGVQSFDDGLLREMGRYEKYGSGAAILERLELAVARFPTVNVDMIFNLPHQDAALLERDLDCVEAGPANQVSFYPLMSARATQKKMRLAMGLPDRGRLAQFYARILARLRPQFLAASAWCFNRRAAGGAASGSDEYVVFAPEYLGLGSGAFSYLGGRVHAATFSLHSYAGRIARGLPGITGARTLGARERMRYDLLMRLFGGSLERDWVRSRYGPRFERTLWPELAALHLLGAVRADARGWRLTDRGMLLWVLMMSAFFESVNELRAQMRARIRDELDGDARAAGEPVLEQASPENVGTGTTDGEEVAVPLTALSRRPPQAARAGVPERTPRANDGPSSG
jgi:coproporphyrinogen III oxidase-like Fe-S oxidoreductase